MQSRGTTTYAAFMKNNISVVARENSQRLFLARRSTEKIETDVSASGSMSSRDCLPDSSLEFSRVYLTALTDAEGRRYHAVIKQSKINSLTITRRQSSSNDTGREIVKGIERIQD